MKNKWTDEKWIDEAIIIAGKIFYTLGFNGCNTGVLIGKNRDRICFFLKDQTGISLQIENEFRESREFFANNGHKITTIVNEN